MSFTDKQTAMLGADLNRANVKSRSQAGRSLSYIESWHAIAEANRIFGYDGWSSETVDIRVVSERERKVGTRQLAGWGVTYIAKVRVEAGGAVREGVGSGHGIDVDLGQAHESAIKEAESDARKRALMTFGNQFGLALYDKEQRNVSDGSEPVDEIPHMEPKEEPTKQNVNAPTPAAASVPAARRIADLIPEVPPTQHPVPGVGQFKDKAPVDPMQSAMTAQLLIGWLTKRQTELKRDANKAKAISSAFENWKMDARAQYPELTEVDGRRVTQAVKAFEAALVAAKPAPVERADEETGEVLD